MSSKSEDSELETVTGKAIVGYKHCFSIVLIFLCF